MICSAPSCDVSIVADDVDLDSEGGRLKWARIRAGYDSAADFSKAAGVNSTTYRAYENNQNGFGKLAAQFARKLGVTAEWLIEGGEEPTGRPPARDLQAASDGDDTEVDELQTVDIEVIDQPWGLGAAFTDIAVQIDKMPFPKTWVEAISISPPALLTWARARGDSMGPTIEDGDLVLLDRSRRKVDEQDALWAFTVGETASIKRLRVKGDRFIILSDNKNVPDDEEPIDFVNIVARVVFVGKRK